MEPELTPDPGSHYGTILERPMSRQSAGFADSASAKPFGSSLASVHRDAVSVAHDATTLPPLVPTAGKVSSSYHHKLAAQRSAADAAAAVKQARYQVALDSNVRRFPVTTRRTRVAYRTRDAQQNWNNEELVEMIGYDDPAAPLALPPIDGAPEYLPIAPRAGASEFGAVEPRSRIATQSGTTSIGVQAAPVGWTRYFFNDLQIARAMGTLGWNREVNETDAAAGPWLYLHFDVRMTPPDQLMWLGVVPLKIENVPDPERPILNDAIADSPEWLQTLYDRVHFASLECHLGQRVTAGGWPDASADTRSKAVWDYNKKRGDGMFVPMCGFDGSAAARANLVSVCNYASIIEPRAREDALALVRLQSGLIQCLISGLIKADVNCKVARADVDEALANLNEEHGALGEKADSLAADLQAAEEKLVQSASEKSKALKDVIDSLNSEFAVERTGLESQISELKELQAAAEAEKEELQNRIKELEKEMDKIISAKGKSDELIPALKEESKLLRESYDKAQKRMKELKDTINSLEKKFEYAEQVAREAGLMLDQKLAECTKLEHAAKELTEALDRESKKVEELSEELHEMKISHSAMAGVSGEKLKELTNKNAELLEAKQNLNEEVKNLRKTLHENTQNDKYLVKRVKEMEAEKEQLEEAKALAETKIQELDAQRQELVVSKKGQVQELRAMKERVAEVETLRSQDEFRKKGLQKEIGRLKASIESLKSWDSADKALVTKAELLEQDLATKEAELAMLRSEKNQLALVNAVHGVRIEQYRSNVGELRERLVGLANADKEADEAEQLVDTMEDKLEKAQGDISSLEQQRAKLSKQVELGAESIDNLEKELRAVKLRLAQRVNEITHLEQGEKGVQVLQAQLDELNGKLAESQTDAQHLRAELFKAKESVEDATQANRDVLENNDNLQRQLRKKDQEIAKLENGRDPSEIQARRIEELEHEVRSLETRLKVEEASRDVEDLDHVSEVQHSKDDEIARLLAELEKKDKELRQYQNGEDVDKVAQQRAQEAEAKALELKNELDEARGFGVANRIREAMMKRDVADMKATIRARDVLLNIRSAELAKLKSSDGSGDASEDSVAKLSEELEKVQKEFGTAEAERLKLSEELSTERSKLETANEKIAALEAGQSTDQFLEHKCAMLEEEIAKMKGGISSLREALTASANEVSEAVQKRGEIQAEMDALEQEFANFKRESSGHNASFEKSAAESLRFTAERARLQSKVDSLEAQVASLRSGASTDDFFQERCAVLEKSLEDMRVELSTAEEKVREHEAKVEQVMQSSATIQEAIHESKSQLAAMERQLSQERARCGDLAASNATLTSKLQAAEALASSASAGQSIDEALKERNASLEEQMEQLASELAQARETMREQTEEIAAASTRVDALTKSLDEAAMKLDGEKAGSKALVDQLAQAESGTEWTMQEMKRLSEELAKSEQSRKQLESLQASNDKDEATAKINEELEAEAISLKAKLQNVESLLASRNSSIEGLQAACAESDKAAADARRDYNKATSELKWQTEKIDKLTKDHAHMKSEVEKLHEKIKATEEGASADEFLSERNRHLEHEMESMRVKIEKLAQLKDKEHAMQQDTNEEALQMEKKFNEATSRMRTLEEKLAQAESESARLAEEKARVDSKLDAANKLLDESRGDKPVDEAIKNSSEAIQAENEELKVKISALEIDIKRTKEDLDSARLTAMKMTAKAAASNMAAEVAVSKIASAESEMQRMLHSSATHSQGSQTDAAEAMQADLPKVEEMMQDSSTGAGLEKNSGDALQAVILWWHSMTSAEASSGHPQMWLAAEDKVYGASIAKMEASMSLASELFPNHKDMSGTFLAYISDIPKASRGDLIVGGEGTIRTAMHENFATFLPEGGKEKADRALESVSDAPATMRAYLTGTVSLGVGKNGKLMIAIPIIAPPLNSGESCNVIGVVTTAPETADGQVPRRKHMDEAKADAAFLALIRGLSNFAGGYGRAAGKIESEDAARIEKTLASMESLDSFSLDLHESLDRQSTEEMQQIVSAAEVGGEEVLEMYVEDAEQLKPAADAKEEESGLASTPLEEEKVLEEKVVDEKKKMLARVESTKELSEVRVKALINLSKVRAANTVLVDMMYQRAQLSQQIMLLLDVIEQSKSLNNALKEIRVYRKVSPLIARMLCAFLILLQPKDEAIFATLPLPEDATPLDESGNVMSCYGFPSHENGVHVVWMVLQRHLKRLGGTITKKLTKMARSVRCPSELSPDDPMLPYAQRSFTTCEALLESFTEAELNKASRALPVIHRFVKALLKRGHVAEKIRALNSFMSDGKGSSPPPIIRTSSIDPQKFVKSMSTKMLMETMITSGEILKESRDEIAKEFAKDGVGSSASVFKARNKNAEVFKPPGP
ncbi:hypothetical protein NFJ02_11g05590 [Pycnococcus provasolii]